MPSWTPLRIAVTTICLSILAFPPATTARAEVLARVDGVEITDADLQIARQDIGKTLPRQMSSAQRNTYLIQYLIDLKVISKAAQASKLQDKAEFKRKLAYFQQKALMEVYMDEQTKDHVTEAKIQAVYDKAKANPEVEVNASHILVPTQKEAESALKRVQSGEDFAKVAKEISKDPGSPGGELGWFTRHRMVPPFAEMAFKTKPGTISPPVKTQFGWHIIRVNGRRNVEIAEFGKVKAKIRTFLAGNAQKSAISRLRDASKIENLATPK